MLLWKRLRDRASVQLPDSPFEVNFADEKSNPLKVDVSAFMVVSP
jgi:hypothetical protein